MTLRHLHALALFLTLAVCQCRANDALTSQPPILLWPAGAPGALGNKPGDIPTLQPFLPDIASSTGAAIVVCPGGGYAALTAHEGADYARWLNELGITAFVLKYRLGSQGYRHPAMLQDATRAIRLVRAQAATWNLDNHRVGIIGSSAGGHLASTIMTHFDAGDPTSTDTVERQNSRPDLGILVYPVVSFGEKGHQGSMHNLLGTTPPPELMKLVSNELQVTKNTPPAFIFHTCDDSIVRVENSLLFAKALASHDIPFALHIYPHGPHGLGLGTEKWNPAARHPWVGECEQWLKEQKFAN
ncbi:MAG: alpha/beta hydrolase [Candidatus Sumerlaeaceae bacterium]